MTIKKLRLRKNLSQKELATLLGVHFQTIQAWESGKTPIPGKRMPKLAEVLGVSIAELISLKHNVSLDELKSIGLIENETVVSKGLVSVLNEINKSLKDIIGLLRN